MIYQTKEGGFEWFGVSPANEALSAYGLMEFYDMMQVSNIVDSTMYSNLKNWLMSRKDGSGGFNISDHWGFGSAPRNTTNAYIVWALTSTGETNVTDEIDALINLAEESISGEEIDTYFLSLVSLSLYNLNRTT